jgi:hypothetical protein
VNTQVQAWAQAWVGQYDTSSCMGIARKLVVDVEFFDS